jgi:uncharacterized protein (TIGR03086 family)
MDTLDLLDDGFAFARVKLVGIGDTPLDTPTPCEDWDLRQLVNHLVNAAGTAAGVLSGEDPVDPWTRSPEDMANTDSGWPTPVTKYDAVTATIVKAARDGALERLYFLHQTDMPGLVLAKGAVFDAVIHAWDVAKATGQDPTIPEPIAAEFLEMASGIPDANRSVAFGPRFVVDDSAPAGDRLVGLLGRHP